MTRGRCPAAVALLLLAGCSRAPRPNLLVVTMDTTRADHLGAYGYREARTPRIDALAAEGVLFRKHMTPVPITLPSHTTLFTGRYPPTHTVRDNGTFVVPAGELTLAEILATEGYDTSAFVSAYPLLSQFGLDQGFSTYDDTVRDLGKAGTGPVRASIYFDERPAAAVVDAAIAYHQARSSTPFFSFVHFFDPHQPQIAPPPYDVAFRQKPYDGEIAYVDEQLGRLFDMLKARGEWENTVVVLTADHGEGLGEHGELTHSILLHQATLHIPLIVRGPGVPVGQVDRFTMSTQLLATMLQLLHLPVPGTPMVGESLLPSMKGEAAPAPFSAYFETIAPRTSQGWSQIAAFMQGDLRLVHAPRSTMHDLASDPLERRDLVAERPEDAARMRSSLRAFLESHETRSVGETFQIPDAEAAERLAALGYLQANPAAMGDLEDMLDVEGRTDPKDRVMDISLFSEAKSALKEGKWDLAMELHRELLARNPDNAAAHVGMAVLYGQREAWDDCLRHIDRAVALSSADTHLSMLRGQLFVEMGRAAEGLEALQAVPTAVDTVEGLTWLGKACTDLGRHAEARAWFEKAVKIEPKHRWLRLYLANELASEGSTEAEAMYRGLIADDPYFALAYYNYGRLLMELQRTDAARRVLQRASQLDPRHELTKEALATLPEAS